MIAREWRCICPAEKIQEFIPYLHSTGVKDSENTPGFSGAEIFYKEISGGFEVVLITFWDSYDSIRLFAGEHIELAVLYPEDYKYGIISDLTVKHYIATDRIFSKPSE